MIVRSIIAALIGLTLFGASAAPAQASRAEYGRWEKIVKDAGVERE